MNNISKERIIDAIEVMQNHIIWLLNFGQKNSQIRMDKEWNNVTKKHYDHCLTHYFKEAGKLSAYEEMTEEIEAFFETEMNCFRQLLNTME